MLIKYFRAQNILPFGNQLYEVRFDDKPASLWQLIGKNGHGKSSLIRIIKIGIYHEYEDILIGDIANSINKNGLIEFGVQSNGHDWVIISKFSPNSVKIYKDGNTEPEDWGGIADTKKKIKSEIVDIPYHIFSNAISLSIDEFKSFISMTPKDTRNIRDRIFGFFIVNEMNELLKPKVSEYLASVSTAQQQIDSILGSIQSTKEEQDNLKQTATLELDTKIRGINEEITGIGKIQGLLSDKVAEGKDYLGDLYKVIEWDANELLKSDINKAKDEIFNYGKKIQEIDDTNKRKETEKSKLDSEKLALELKDSIKKAKDTKDAIDKIKIDKDKLEKDLESIKVDRDKVNSQFDQLSKEKLEASFIDNILDFAGICMSLQHSYKTLKESLTDFEWKLQKAIDKDSEGETFVRHKQTELDELNRRIKAYENKVCHECGADYSSEEQQGKIAGFKADAETLTGKISVANENLDKLRVIKGKISSNVDSIKKQLLSVGSDFNSIKNDLKFTVITNEEDLSILKNNLYQKIELMASGNTDVDFTEFIESIPIIYYDADKYKEVLTTKEQYDGKHDVVSKQVEQLSSDLKIKESVYESIKDVSGDTSVETRFTTKVEYDEGIKVIGDEIKVNLAKKSTLSESLGEYKAAVTRLQDQVKSPEYFDSLIMRNSIEEYRKSDMYTLIGVNKEIEYVNATILSDEQQISDYQVEINSKLSFINELKGQMVDDKVKSLTTLIDKFKKDIDVIQQNKDNASKNLDFLKIVQWVLSDEGIKSYILKDIVPSINGEIKRILDLLGVPIEAMLDSEFKVHLYRFGEEVSSLPTVSTGQKKMINCAILLAITVILKMKYRSTNVVFYDEMFSSLDPDNRATLLEIVKSLCCDQLGIHSIIVAHNYLPSPYFGYIIKVLNRNNFSSIDVVTRDEYTERYLSSPEN